MRGGSVAAMIALAATSAQYRCPVRAADETATVSAPAASDLRRADWIKEGRARFVAACSRCHGMTGDSGIVKPFRERSDWSASEIYDVIAVGRVRGAVAMPAWGGAIPDQEIWKLVAYIKSLSAGSEGPAAPDRK